MGRGFGLTAARRLSLTLPRGSHRDKAGTWIASVSTGQVSLLDVLRPGMLRGVRERFFEDPKEAERQSVVNGEASWVLV